MNYLTAAFGSVSVNTKIDSKQVKNNAGSFVYEVSDLQRFKRFIFLGSSSDTMYQSSKTLTVENLVCLERIIANGTEATREVIDFLQDVSNRNRAGKLSQMLFSLAYISKLGDAVSKKYLYSILDQFIKTASHLFEYIEYSKQISKEKLNSVGFGRLHRNFILQWYNSKTPQELAYQVLKYRCRNNWNHKDLFRLVHIVPKSIEHNLLYKYVIRNEAPDIDQTVVEVSKDGTILNLNSTIENTLTHLNSKMTSDAVFDLQKVIHYSFKDEANKDTKSFGFTVKDRLFEVKVREGISSYIANFTILQKTTSEITAASLIRDFKFTHEFVPTNLLNSKIVWQALLESMPVTALVRNLNKLTSIGIFDNDTNYTNLVCKKLTDVTILKKSMIHPLRIITGMLQYSKGRGNLGKLSWSPNQKIIDALNDAYYKSFEYTEPTNKTFFIALDVSGSMEFNNCVGANFTPREGSAALALCLMKLENNCILKGFSTNLCDVPISPSRRLDDNIKTISKINMGATNLVLPIEYAITNKIKVDCFVCLSDNETNMGAHLSPTLRKYRNSINKDAKYVNIQMSATQFSCADPGDINCLELAGFDAGFLSLISEFVNGF